MSTIVTGGAGRIGNRLTERLMAKGEEVVVVDNFSNSDREAVPEGAHVIEEDVRHAMAIPDDAGLIYHLAAQVDVQESFEHPIETTSVNALGTLQVLEAARRTGARVVIASTAAAYSQDRPTTMSPYGLSKRMGDSYATLYEGRYGVDAVILRYFNVFGPGQQGVVRTFLEQADEGGPLTVYGHGKQTRDFIHVDDVIEATILAAEHGKIGRIYDVGTESSTSVRELAEVVQDETNVAITHQRRPAGDVDRSEADLTRAQLDLGFSPTIRIEEWVREQL